MSIIFLSVSFQHILIEYLLYVSQELGPTGDIIPVFTEPRIQRVQWFILQGNIKILYLETFIQVL